MNKKVLIKKLQDVFNMNNQFIKLIKEHELKLRITSARSNTIGSQLACVARARDAYSKSILKDEAFSWNPDFLYDDRYNHIKLEDHLINECVKFIDKLEVIDSFSDNQLELLIDLIGHEFLHQGQLVRYIYSNNLIMPSSVKAFWHLED